nr:BrnA antitoxin family protein [Gemmatimonadota bacterium]
MREEYDFSVARRGAIDPLPAGKTRITIRLDDDILDWFRARVESAGGGNYQTLINAALREHLQQQQQ